MFRTQRLAILLLLVAAVTLGSFDANASHTRYVREGGSNGFYINFGYGRYYIHSPCRDPNKPCATINHAIKIAGSGDLIKVARGLYSENLSVKPGPTNLVVRGGWSHDFTSHHGFADNTEIRAEWGSHSFVVHGGSLSITFRDLQMTAGERSDPPTRVITVYSGLTSIINGDFLGSFYLRGYVKINLQNVHLGNPFMEEGLAIRAETGLWSDLKLNLIDSWADGGAILAKAHGGYGWSNLTINLRDSKITRANQHALKVVSEGSGARAVVSVVESEIRGNWNGVYALGDVSLDIENSFIVENHGVGIRVESGADATVLYSTITANRDGIIADGHSMEVMNTIVWGNDADVRASAGSVYLSHSDVGSEFQYRSGGSVEHESTVNVDPQFVRLEMDWYAIGDNLYPGNYHLRETSPLIDRAPCGEGEEYDFDGDERPLGNGCEIGADEVRPTAAIPITFLREYYTWYIGR